MADLPESHDEHTPEPSGFLVVGLGASAGGIEALQQFFAHVSADSGLAYVVILHLSPAHDSQLASVLQTVTAIPVTQVTARVRVEPNHVYVIPPSQHLMMIDGEVAVVPTTQMEERRAPIDLFFRTLAETHQARAVCVVLSGTGTDGSMGLKRIKERGGAVFVQNPSEAAFDEMPRNAIATDLVDEVLPATAIPGRIVTYASSLGTIAIPAEPEQRSDDQQQALREVLAQLRVRTGHDFANYKRPTLLRRIERHIIVRNLPDLPAYAAFLREHGDEAQALLKDLLISVTNFFRDQEAFVALEHDILPRLFHGKRAGEQVRIWVVGCATGEEAYSIAMLCAERVLDTLDAPSVQIFATDIDEAALARARAGVYTMADTADISPERLRRFFTLEEGHYRVRRELREMVLFAKHNVLRDPPFAHLDLATCRNLLIYFNHTAQELLLETLHFALNPGKYLFLGSAESIDIASDLYTSISREQRIFQSRPTHTRPFPVPESVTLPRVEPPRLALSAANPNEPEHERLSYGELHHRLLEQYAPPSVVINQDYEIVHLVGRAGRYFEMPTGAPSTNLLELIRPELRLELRSVLYQAVQQQANVDASNLPITIDGRTETVTIHVRPVLHNDDPARGFVMVLFAQGREGESETDVLVRSDEATTRHIDAEVERLRLRLRTSSEQYEVQAEELKASNEELHALNEELRSSNEELETSKEELQSLNEELRTVNQELKVKVEEATQSTINLQNLVNATDIATIFLDTSSRIRLFTPAARALFNLIPADYGRPLSHITHRLLDADVMGEAERVFATLQAVEHEVRTADDRVFLMRVLPYRIGDDRIGGVVLTFVDITARQRAEAASRESQQRLRLALDAANMGTFVYHIAEDRGEPDARMLELFGLSEDGTLNLAEALTKLLHPDDRVRYAEQVARATDPASDGLLQSDIRVLQPDGSVHWVAVTAQVLFEDEPRRATLMYGVASDITERKQADERQAFLLKLSDALRPLSEPQELQAMVTRTALEHFNADRCYYCEIEHGSAVIRQDSARGSLPSVVGVYEINSQPLFKAVVDAGRPFIVQDTYTTDLLDEPLRQVCIQLQIISFINVPVVKDDQPVGILAVTQCAPRAWTAFDVELAVEVAERTWAAVERARAEAVLREREAELARIQLIGGIAGVMIDAVHDLSGQRSPEYQRLHGLPPEQIAETHEQWLERLHPDDRQEADTVLRHALTSNQSSYRNDYRIIRPRDGQERWISTIMDIERDDDGKPLRLIGAHIDITERKRAEEALRESDARFRTLADAVPQVIWANNADGRANYFNRRWYDYSGLSYEQSAGPGWQAIVHPDDAPASGERWQQALARGQVFDTEYRLRRADGAYRWHIGRNVPLRDEHGQVTGWFGTATDIEDLKQAEAAVRQSEERFRLLVEGARDYAMFLLDPAGRITFWSTGAERVFGWSEAEVLGQSGSIIFAPEDRERGAAEHELQTALTQGRAEDRRWHVRKDGSRLFADGLLVRLDDDNGQVRAFVKIGRDATVQHEAEQALQRAHDQLETRVQERTSELAAANHSLEQEIAERQQLAEQRAGLMERILTEQETERLRIARELHDTLGQFLSALRMRLSIVQSLNALPPKASDELAQLLALSGRIDHEVDRLTMELRPPALQDFGLPDALRSYAEEWSASGGVPVDVVVIGLESTRLRPAIESTVYRIVQEALTNVLKHAQASEASVLVERRPGVLRVIIEDNGVGFEASEGPQAGVGGRQVGLLGMKERATLVGGELTIESVPGSGTTIYLHIPIGEDTIECY